MNYLTERISPWWPWSKTVGESLQDMYCKMIDWSLQRQDMNAYRYWMDHLLKLQKELQEAHKAG